MVELKSLRNMASGQFENDAMRLVKHPRKPDPAVTASALSSNPKPAARIWLWLDLLGDRIW